MNVEVEILKGMAADNCKTAQGFIDIGRLDLAREHLRSALKQIGQAEDIMAKVPPMITLPSLPAEDIAI